MIHDDQPETQRIGSLIASLESRGFGERDPCTSSGPAPPSHAFDPPGQEPVNGPADSPAVMNEFWPTFNFLGNKYAELSQQQDTNTYRSYTLPAMIDQKQYR